MATSNASEQHLFHSPNYPNQIESDVDLRHRLGISDMGNSEMSPTKRNSSKHYYQGGYEYDFVNEHEWRRHECPICLACLRDPHQTSCGHRFCYTCILTWLSEGKTCPHDNCTIGEGDIFPDTYANREILQLLVRCPYSKQYGCTSIIPLADVETHAEECTKKRQPQKGNRSNATESFTCPSCGELTDLPDIQRGGNSKRHNLICPNAEVACPLAAAGCSDKIPRALLGDHIQNSTAKHVQFLWERLLKLQQMQNAQDTETCSAESSACIDTAISNNTETSSLNGDSSDIPNHETATPNTATMSRDPLRMSGSNLHSTQRLLKDLFHRVVSLEQKNRQMEILNVNMREQVKQLKLQRSKDEEKWDVLGKVCNGKFVWKITNFSEQYQKMLQNNQFVIYSHPFYTSPFGYKMCLRGNMKKIDNEEYFGLFIHLMKGDNDDIIDWPFEGKVFITVKNRDLDLLQREDFHDMIVTSSDSEAFQRPYIHRNEVGIGHPDFIRVNALYSGGFVKYPTNDILVIKVNVICTGNDD